MPKLTAAQTQQLQDAKTNAKNLADGLRDQARVVRGLKAFDDDILYVREYPQRFRNGLDRGSSRLIIAAQALDSVQADIDAVIAGKTPTGFRSPGDLGGDPARWHGKRTKIDPPKVRDKVAQCAPAMHKAADSRSLLGRITNDLDGASKQDTAVIAATITTAKGSLANFETYLGDLVKHVNKMVVAIEEWDRKGQKGRRPPLPGAKVKKPGKGRPGGTTGKPTGKPSTKWPGQKASKQDVACYLAAQAKKYGLPPTLPVTAALVESNLGNIGYGDRDSVGLFQIRADMHKAPPGFGSASGKIQPASWWVANPDAQMKWFAIAAKQAKHGSGTDAATIGTWAANTERPAEQYRGRYQQRFPEAKKYVEKCAKLAQTQGTTGGVGGGNGTGHAKKPLPGRPGTPAKRPGGQNGSGEKSKAEQALAKALAELRRGVKEVGGEDRGKDVEKYLKEAGERPGVPWCAAFVYWCLTKSGFKMPDGYWARADNFRKLGAEGKTMFIVGHKEARPGDIIVWANHIGIVESCKNGTITFVAGNHSDAVRRDTTPTSNTNYTIVRPRAQA